MNGLQVWRFYLCYASRSLQRAGVRTLLAGLSIAFGVVSIVAMQTLAGTLQRTLFDERLRYGGDAEISLADTESALTQAELAQIEAWQREGLVRSISPLALGNARYLRRPESGRITFLGTALGIDPTRYPLVGEFRLREPNGRTLAELLQHPSDALITRDLADKLGLRIGDRFLLGGGEVMPATLTVAGVVQTTPNQQGSTVFYSLAGAQWLANRHDVVTSVSLQWGSVPNGAQAITTRLASTNRLTLQVARTPEALAKASKIAILFDMMLKGAGVLGLLVGGLGVSNTLQVILARRKVEMAILKTLGYRQSHLLWLIGLETALLGLISSVIGAGLGALLGGKLLDLLSMDGTLLVDGSPAVGILVGGVLVGLVTAVVFGLQAVLTLSATRPVEVLRDLPSRPTRSTLIGQGALFVGLFLLFGGLVGWVLGSVINGIAYVLIGALLLAILRVIFQIILWAVLRLPLPLPPLLHMARANLKQRGAQASLILIALCAGVFAITLAALVIDTAQNRLNERQVTDEGYNLLIDTTADAVKTVTQQIGQQRPNAFYTRYLTTASLDDTPILVEGRTAADLSVDMQVEGDWASADHPALLPATAAQLYRIGDRLTLAAEMGGAHPSVTVTLVGFYTTVGNYASNLSNLPSGIIVTPQDALALGGARLQARFVVNLPVERLEAATDALGQALPNALVLSKSDLTKRMLANFRSFFAFAVSVAGLAGVAGMVLIANAAGLAVIERRREIGIFKAVGYQSSQVLRMLVSEYALLGLLAGGLGLLAVLVTLLLINQSQPAIDLRLEPPIAGEMILLSGVVAIVSALCVAWRPTRLRPLDVLRSE